MYYHASPTKGITELVPRISNHGTPLVYFSTKRENVLVYLSNAVEKYCRETNYKYDGIWQKWAPYGFDKDGRQRIEEYYPNALEKTYKGVSGYIYAAEEVEESSFRTQIPHAAASDGPVKVAYAEFVSDAYEAILAAEKKGLITITRYEEMTERMHAWNEKMIKKEYENALQHPEYRHFLLGNFPDLLKDMK